MTTSAAVAATGRRILRRQMVAHARRALACAGAGNRVGFKFHAQLAHDLKAVIEREYGCPQCATQYFQPQECDWCPGQQAIPASNPATH